MKRYIVLFVLCLISVKPVLASCNFMCGVGTGATVTVTPEMAASAGGQAIVPENMFCTYVGHVFAGWTAGSAIYQPGDTLGLLTCAGLGTTNFTAVWQEATPSDSDRFSVVLKSYVDAVGDTRQNKLSGTFDRVVIFSGIAGTVGEREIVTTLGSDASATTLPTAGAVVTGLNTKQNEIPANDNRVITYTGTQGSLSSIGIYSNTGTYSGQTGTLAEVQHVNGAITNGFDAHIVCDEYATPGDSTTECILWRINQLSGTYVPENQ